MKIIDTSTEAQSYSSVAGILAGFSLTAMILIMDKSDSMNMTHEKFEEIIIMFLVSFSGFVTSAISFAVQSRFTENNKLQHSKNFILGYATAVPVILMFSGLLSVVEVFMMSNLASIFNISIFFAVFTISMTPSLSSKKSWDPINLPRGKTDQWKLYVLAYGPIIIAAVIRLGMHFLDKTPWWWLFYATVAALFILNVVGNFLVDIMETKYEGRTDNFQLPYTFAVLWVSIHAVFFGLMLFK